MGCVWAQSCHALLHVVCVQSAAQYQRFVSVLLYAAPVKCFAAPAVAAYMRIEQYRRCAGVGGTKLYQIPCLCVFCAVLLSDSIRYAGSADIGVGKGFAESGRLVTMKLQNRLRNGMGSCADCVLVGIDEQQYGGDERGQQTGKLLCLCECYRAWAGRVEYEADGVYARLCRCPYVLWARQPAYFDGGAPRVVRCVVWCRQWHCVFFVLYSLLSVVGVTD